jgi:hypothetical protein
MIAYIANKQNPGEEKRGERPACEHKSYSHEISHSQTFVLTEE